MSNSVRPADDDGLDLVGLVQMLWRYRLIIVAAGLLGAGIAVILALTATPIFRAEAVVTDVQDGPMGGASSLANQLGGLASLAGVNIGQGSDKSRQNDALLDSRFLAEEFIKRNNLLPELFRESTKPPTLWLAVDGFKNGILSVRKDARKGITTVAVEWTDAVTAARWANGVVTLANELTRKRALDESNRNIAYLNAQLERTNIVELRKVIYNIIESETKTLMLASGRAEYAFELVDPAVAPEQRIRPRRTLMVIVGGVLGGFAGVALAFVLNAVARHRARQP
jgi:uncharacterized protein involved in exopolysaccharide biosynthesis